MLGLPRLVTPGRLISSASDFSVCSSLPDWLIVYGPYRSRLPIFILDVLLPEATIQAMTARDKISVGEAERKFERGPIYHERLLSSKI
ncbi:unnamed protein product [Oncorhynchus mykiss]|uniref:PWWP domain-containing protein n=1 Tax=Oncorhynchus mykiss TaxID=8022 RepID=A0A060W5S1_ONCMY|nr:unnamed protein product [Oncorhynchus mykiss]